MAVDEAGTGRDEGDGDDSRIDLRDVKRLLNLMDRHGLSEMEIEEPGRRVRLRKPSGGGTLPAPAPAPAPAAPAAAPAGGETAAEAAPPPAAGEGKGVEIRSPMVGTFYRSPNPESAPFVEVGDRVNKDMVVCIVEAMKVMNEIKAEVDGEVLAVLVQNGEAVEFDQPLFLVKPAG